MKKILLLLLFTIASYGQAVFDEGIQIKNNTTDNSATKVNVQSTDGTINTISKSDLVNVVEVNDVPSLPLIGEAGKIYVVKNLNKIYRWNGTFYQELAVTDISGKENSANKQNSLAVDGTNTKYPTVTAVNGGLDLKANSASPALTGTPTAPTATAGTNTTQIATTAFVTGADAGNVKLTGNQTITGLLSFNRSSTSINAGINLSVSTGSGTPFSSVTSGTNTAAALSSTSSGNALFVSSSSSGHLVVANSSGSGLNYIGQNNGTNTFTVNKFGATTATSFIKSSAPTTNILLAGGSDVAQNTAFNKPFGITAGTVVEGGSISGTVGYLPKFTSSGTVGNGSIFDNGNVGIGTTTPSRKLSIGGTTTAYQAFQTTSKTVTIGSDGSGEFIVADDTAGAYRMQINNGKVTINDLAGAGTRLVTASPAGELGTTAIPDSRPYKVYTALLSQIGNAAPTATVLENTLGGTVVWSRTGTGVYTATLNEAFPLGKTTVMPFFGSINGGVNLSQTISGVRIDNNSVGIRTSAGSTLTDVLLLDATIEIRVYL